MGDDRVRLSFVWQRKRDEIASPRINSSRSGSRTGPREDGRDPTVYRELGRGHNALRSERFLLDASAVLLRAALAEPFGFDTLAISMDLPAAALVRRTPG